MVRESISCNIAIYPPLRVSRKAIKESRMLRRMGGLFVLGGRTYYPHITLYMTEFPKENIKIVKKILRQITTKVRPFKMQSMTYRQTEDGFVSVRFEKSRNLMRLHEKVVKFLNPVREGLLRQQDILRLAQRKYNKRIRRSLKLYGYQRPLSLYDPHLTLTKFENPPRGIITHLPKLDFSFRANELALFQSAEHGTCGKLIARFNFALSF